MADKKNSRIIKFIGESASYDDDSGYIRRSIGNGDSQRLLEVMGLENIEAMFKKDNEAMKFFDDLGEFIAEAITEKIDREKGKEKIRP